jgi:sigma-B regulation protein RsbU (phosphoserine phosphatase)
LRDLNNAVTQQNPKCQFVTVSFCVFNPASRTLEVSSAGHPLPLIRHQDGSVETIPVRQGPALGFANRAECYPKMDYQIQCGDLLLLYTDGVTEAPASENSMFGTERLCAALGKVPFPSQLNQWTESLRKSIQGFTGNEQQEDDITLALLRVH